MVKIRQRDRRLLGGGLCPGGILATAQKTHLVNDKRERGEVKRNHLRISQTPEIKERCDHCQLRAIICLAIAEHCALGILATANGDYELETD